MKKKCVLITGGTKGIGKAISEKFLANDFYVIATFLSDQNAANIAKKNFENISSDFLIKQVNMSEEIEVEKLQEFLQENDLEPQYLVNNAGITHENSFLLDSNKSIADVISNNLFSVINTCKIFSKYMIYKKFGKIINISSVAAEYGVIGLSAYSASKGAINAYTNSIAKELAPFNIAVNTISPGFIESDMTKNLKENHIKIILDAIPMKRFGQPSEVAELVFEISALSSQYLTGSNIIIDGGFIN